MLRYKKSKIPHLKNRLDEYRDKYGDRSNFSEFEEIILRTIKELEEGIAKLESGKVRYGKILLIGTPENAAELDADYNTSMAAHNSELLTSQ
jgi:hypothetical protein